MSSLANAQLKAKTTKAKLTRVAEIPGYPTRKLLFGGPETLTKAAILSRAHAGATARFAPS